MTQKQKMTVSFVAGVIATPLIGLLIVFVNTLIPNKRQALPISFKDAREMYKNKHPILSFKAEAKYVLFTYNELKKFMETSVKEIEGRIRRAPNMDSVGIRVYFAAYTGDIHPDQEVRYGWSNRETIFFVPTYQLNESGRDSVNYDIINKDEKLAGQAFLLGARKNEIMNHGALCPPETNCEDKGSAFENQ